MENVNETANESTDQHMKHNSANIISKYSIEPNISNTTYNTSYSSINHNEITSVMITTYSLSRTVMLFAITDIFFDIVNMLNSFYYIFPLVFSIYGYCGAKKFSISYSTIYFINVFTTLIIRLYTSIHFILLRIYNKPFDENKNGTVNKIMIFIDFGCIVLGLLINLWMTHIIYLYIKSLKTITLEEKERMILIKNMNYNYILW